MSFSCESGFSPSSSFCNTAVLTNPAFVLLFLFFSAEVDCEIFPCLWGSSLLYTMCFVKVWTSFQFPFRRLCVPEFPVVQGGCYSPRWGAVAGQWGILPRAAHTEINQLTAIKSGSEAVDLHQCEAGLEQMASGCALVWCCCSMLLHTGWANSALQLWGLFYDPKVF